MMDTLPQPKLSDLIGRVYDCSLDPPRWESTLAEVKDLLRCSAVVLHLNDTQRDQLLLHKGIGLDPQWVERMGQYVPEMHALLPSEPMLDEPYVLSRDVPRSVIEASPYVQKWMKPQGLVDVTQLFLLHTPTRYSGFGLSRHESVGEFRDGDIELLRLLLPHVRRAVIISNVLEVQAIEQARMADTLDAMKVGAVLANEDSRILYANRAARAMMRDGGPLRDNGGILSAVDPTASAEIKSAVGIAARSERDIGKTGLSVRLTHGVAPATVAHVLPLRTSELRARLEPGSVAAVFINPATDDAASAMAIAESFGLTPAETRLLTQVLSGKTVIEAADELRIATTTARTHLARIFDKTGVSRQSELFRLAIRITPPT